MERKFSDVLSALRRNSGRSQRTVAAELGISQALLSHYENGAREPGLAFVCKACDYYGVSADYMLGRSLTPLPPSEELERLKTAIRSISDSAALAQDALDTLTGEENP